MAIVTEKQQFHVLAVDDSITDRKLIERLLKTSSFQVTTVDSGSKALEFLGLVPPPSVSSYPQEIQVNLVITDYCMPGMTGYDLLKKIKESSSLKDIPVVIMSSENAPSRINRCLEEGAEEFLLKPVQLSDMKKLRPHILKGKCKEHQETEQKQQQSQQSNCSIEITTQQSQNNCSIEITTPQSQNNCSIEITKQQSQNNCSIEITTTISSNTNKRKTMDDDGLAPERSRTRYNVDTLNCMV